MFPPIFPYFLQQKSKHFAIKFSFLYQYKQAFYQYLQGKSPLKPRLSHAFIYKTSPFFYGYPYRFPSLYANRHRVFSTAQNITYPVFAPLFTVIFPFPPPQIPHFPSPLKRIYPLKYFLNAHIFKAANSYFPLYYHHFPLSLPLFTAINSTLPTPLKKNLSP